MTRNYNPADPASIFGFSKQLLDKTLVETMAILDPSISATAMNRKGKGALGTMVEEFVYGRKPNSDPMPDFNEAGVELKATPLKKGKKELLIKERLVIDVINYCSVVEKSFEDSMVYKKFLLMLILFYIHADNTEWKDMKFIYSVLWQIKDNDLEIIKQDYYIILNKIKEGKAHELSESDTYYLAACTKGKDSSSLRRQPFSNELAKQRAFSLKASYMRTILDFVRNSGSNMISNTGIRPELKQLVSVDELRQQSFEHILIDRFVCFYGHDYKQIAEYFRMKIKPKEKSKYARISKRILLDGLNSFDEAEEIRKAGIIAKTIRIEANGKIKEHMSFENIDYEEIHSTEDWTESRWYEIVNSRMMLIVFRREDLNTPEWQNERRYVLDKIVFTSFPNAIHQEAKLYWQNIKNNVENNTLRDANEDCDKKYVNSFWRLSDHHNFHVRPKAQTSLDKTTSPITGEAVRKKCYWLDNRYLTKILQLTYGSDWDIKFKNNESSKK